MPLIKLFILAVLLVIVLSLASALFHLTRGTARDRHKLARALTVRITLSLALLLFIVIAARLGWLSPHGLLGGAVKP